MGLRIILILGIGSILFTWIVLFMSWHDSGKAVTNKEVSPETALIEDVPKQSITTISGNYMSAEKVVNHPDTVILSADGFYENTADTDAYAIFYDEPSGNISVALRSDPLDFSRSLAEKQLLEVLSITEEDLCEIGVLVTVHRDVNPQYAVGDLGLSFCAGSKDLP